jgi:OmcA/MtrC family decaheme c-type cytochrome
MNALTRLTLLAALASLAACGGGGGGGGGGTVAAGPAGVVPGAQPNPTASASYADAASLRPFITAASVPADGQVVVEFQLTDDQGVAIVDLTAGDIRLTIAKLGFSSIGNLRGDWQSYINEIELPGVGPGLEQRLQATFEAGTAGNLDNNSDGTYRYRFAASISNITDSDILDQAADEDLDLSYQPERTHRVAMEFRNAATPANTSFDWIPETGISQIDGIFHYDVAATANCDDCHQQLSFHGGSRIEHRYCVTCHNPGTTDANSGNSVSMREMAHKIHLGAGLPSVRAGTPYVFYGFQDRPVDYSNVRYPNDILSCAQCHGGNATGENTTQATDAGDNWSQFATREACGSCHDDLDFAVHFGGQANDENCMSCHQTTGVAGSIQESHGNESRAATGRFEARILDIRNTAPGEFPMVQFSIVDPQNGDRAYDLENDPEWTNPPASRLAIDLAWSTTDYANSGNQGDGASAVSINALTDPEAVGDGSYIVTSAIAIPDGSLAPNIAATGSGGAVVEGHASVDFGTPGNPSIEQVPLRNVVDYFSIDESSGNAIARREIADLDGCLGCHGQLSLHGDNRTDTVQGCATCHNPRNTDKSVREIALNPPTDGKDEESIDFKTMVHGIHASAFRTAALQIVGFRGFTTYVYDEEHVQYPGDLKDCRACHLPDTFTLPLNAEVLGTTFDTGADITDPTDDRVVTATSSTCSACHDAGSSKAHMENNGGSFDTTQQAIDAGLVIEQCDVCHGEGRSADVRVVHSLE